MLVKVGSIVTPLFAFCELNIGFVPVAAQMLVSCDRGGVAVTVSMPL